MFLFPWLDWGIDISDFEKIDFLGHEAISGCSQPLVRPILNSNDTYVVGQKILKNVVWKNFFEKFLEKLLSFPEIYFGHTGTIQSIRTRLLPKISKKYYCPFQKVGPSKGENLSIKNWIFFVFFRKFQFAITFFLLGLWKRHRYEKGSIFHEVFENHHHLSKLLN